MGRYYHGDIEGKFWFAVQSSDDGEHFGATECEPSYIQYHAADLEAAEEGIRECKKNLRGFLTKMNKFFKRPGGGYNDNMLAEYLKIDEEHVSILLVNYARLQLGIQIRDCIKETGECWFEAEL